MSHESDRTPTPEGIVSRRDVLKAGAPATAAAAVVGCRSTPDDRAFAAERAEAAEAAVPASAYDAGSRVILRPGPERGTSRTSWLRSFHSFSFADYFDPRHMGYRSLRVINEDWIDAGRGFGMHPHRDMEIISWVLAGELEHRDSLGTGSVIRPGESQKMSAGTGIRHSEFATTSETVHLVQIWILPDRAGLAPSYEQRALEGPLPGTHRQVIASPEGRRGGVSVHQDATLYRVGLGDGDEEVYTTARDRYHWVQVTRGSVVLNGQHLAQGDAAAVESSRAFALRGAAADTEVLLFDLA